MTEAERKEKMNELMNRISFALKDNILAQGFEIICQRLAKLEKGNEELEIANGHQALVIKQKDALILKMKAQIEKMKCCENCEFWQDNDCKRWNNTNTDDYWELKE